MRITFSKKTRGKSFVWWENFLCAGRHQGRVCGFCVVNNDEKIVERNLPRWGVRGGKCRRQSDTCHWSHWCHVGKSLQFTYHSVVHGDMHLLTACACDMDAHISATHTRAHAHCYFWLLTSDTAYTHAHAQPHNCTLKLPEYPISNLAKLISP